MNSRLSGDSFTAIVKSEELQAPNGLLLDKGQLGELGTSHLVARQELRELVRSLALPEFIPPQPRLELA